MKNLDELLQEYFETEMKMYQVKTNKAYDIISAELLELKIKILSIIPAFDLDNFVTEKRNKQLEDELLTKMKRDLQNVLEPHAELFYNDDTEIQYHLSDSDNDYYILVAIPMSWIERHKLTEPDYKYFSEICIIFDTSESPKFDSRVKILQGNKYVSFSFNTMKSIIYNLNKYIEI